MMTLPKYALAKVGLVAVSVAALGGMSTAAYAADPVSLPAGDTIYQANYFDDPTALWTTASDGTATLVGTPGTSGLIEVVDGAWNPVTNRSYVIGKGYEGPCELWEADLTTGQFTFVAEITSFQGLTYNCDGFDIAPDGTAWVTVFRNTDIDTDAQLAKLNLTDGELTEDVSVIVPSGPSWIVVQPSTGVIFLGSFDNDLYTVDPVTGEATFVATGNFGEGVTTYDAAFDKAGRLWITGWPDGTELFSADVADYALSIASQGLILLDGVDDGTGTDSLWIVRGAAAAPAPALANTGLDNSGVLALGGALLLAGAGALALRRVRRA